VLATGADADANDGPRRDETEDYWAIKSSEGNHLLRRHVQDHDGRRQHEGFLGEKFTVQDGLQRRRPRQERSRYCCRWHDGRSGVHHLRQPGRNQRLDQASVLKEFTMLLRTLSFTLALVAFFAGQVSAAEYKVGSIEISDPWSRATPKGTNIGAGYMTIENRGTEPDRLVAGNTDVSAGVQLHEMTLDREVAKMREMKAGIEIKPGQTVKLKPGSSHVMFVNLKRQLVKGEIVKGTLTFERAGTVTVEYP